MTNSQEFRKETPFFNKRSNSLTLNQNSRNKNFIDTSNSSLKIKETFPY